jgi:hypothetical protein
MHNKENVATKFWSKLPLLTSCSTVFIPWLKKSCDFADSFAYIQISLIHGGNLQSPIGNDIDLPIAMILLQNEPADRGFNSHRTI